MPNIRSSVCTHQGRQQQLPSLHIQWICDCLKADLIKLARYPELENKEQKKAEDYNQDKMAIMDINAVIYVHKL